MTPSVVLPTERSLPPVTPAKLSLPPVIPTESFPEGRAEGSVADDRSPKHYTSDTPQTHAPTSDIGTLTPRP